MIDSCYSFSIIYIGQCVARGTLGSIVNKTTIVDVGSLFWLARMEIRKRNKDEFMISRSRSEISCVPRAD